MTTLAELTPEQRKKCVGMWVDTPWGLGVLLGIYDDWDCEGPVVWCHERSQIASARWLLNQVTLRPDLPRAWNPDGTSLAGEWDYRAPYLGKYGEGLTDTEIAEFKADGDQLERRWVGEWEPINA